MRCFWVQKCLLAIGRILFVLLGFLNESVSIAQNQSSTYYLIETTSSVALGSSPVLSHTTQSDYVQASSNLSTQSTYSKMMSSASTQPASSSFLSTQSTEKQMTSSYLSTQPIHSHNSSSYLTSIQRQTQSLYSSPTHSQMSSAYLLTQSIHPHDSSFFLTASIRPKTSSFYSSPIHSQMSSSYLSTESTHPHGSSSASTYGEPSSTKTMIQGSQKTFIAEIRITSHNFTSELENKTSYQFLSIADDVTRAVDTIMDSKLYYLGSQVIYFREGSVISNVEIKMGAGSSSDPNIVLDPLKSAIKSGQFGNLTVDSTYFVGWLKINPPSREKLLSGQLGGVALIVFIVVILLLIICLGKFADEPLFQERDIFSMESSTRHMGSSRDNTGIEEDEDWKFDPLFAWSNQKSFDSKL